MLELLNAYNAGLQEWIKKQPALETLPQDQHPGPIKQSLSSPYYAQSHSTIERYFSSFSQSLRRLIAEYPSTWAQYAGRIAIVLNNTRHRATGFSPNHLHLGLAPSSAYPDFLQVLDCTPDNNRTQWVADRIRETEVARDMAYRNLEHYYHLNDQQWSRHHAGHGIKRDHGLEPGEMVLVKRLSGTEQVAAKLSTLPAMLGPAVVRRLLGTKAVLIQYLATGQFKVRNYRHLVRFAPPSPNAADIEDIKYYNAPKTKNAHDELLAPLEDRDDFARGQNVFAKDPHNIDMEEWRNMAIQEADQQILPNELIAQTDLYAKDDAPNMTYEEIMDLEQPAAPPPLTTADRPDLEPWQDNPHPVQPEKDHLSQVVDELENDAIDDRQVEIREDQNEIRLIPPRDEILPETEHLEDHSKDKPSTNATQKE